MQADREVTVNKACQEKWQSQGRKYENLLKMHARAEVMPNGASKAGHFTPTRQNILFLAQHKAEMPLHKWRF